MPSHRSPASRRPDLPRARPSRCPAPGSRGDMCTGPEDTGEPREVRGVGAGAPRVEGRPRPGPWPLAESPRVAAGERRPLGQDGAGSGGGRREGGWGLSPGSNSRRGASGWDRAVSFQRPASCRANSWARKSMSSSSLGWGGTPPGRRRGHQVGSPDPPSSPSGRWLHPGAGPQAQSLPLPRLLPGPGGPRTGLVPSCPLPSWVAMVTTKGSPV